MKERRKHARWDVNLPILCNIKTDEQDILVSAVGEVKNICLGGMKINLPLRLEGIQSRLIEYSLDLPAPFARLEGAGIIRWGDWDESADKTYFGLEISELESDQFLNLENILIDLAGDRSALFLSTLAN